MILTGVVNLILGRDQFEKESGAFTVLNLDALADHYMGIHVEGFSS